MIELSFGALGLLSTNVIVAVILAGALLVPVRTTQHQDLLPVSVAEELKGLAILGIVLAHISYMLVTDNQYLFPLSIAAGVGVDLFLFLSGFGLTIGLLNKPMSPLQFYRRRLIKVFIPLWVVLALLFAADAVFLHRYYSLAYMVRSALGWFPTAAGFEDVNSPFWYISWLLMFYVLLPLLFSSTRPWVTALLLAVIANMVAVINPFDLQVNWLHRLHTTAFSLGILVAWAIHEPEAGRNSVAAMLKAFRNNAAPVTRYFLLLVMLVVAAYFASNNTADSWPGLAAQLQSAGIDANVFISQATSLITMLALLIVFSLKRIEFRVLSLFGVYSFETYLIHWPLMSRYDIFFRDTPPWLAPLLWLSAFIALGWFLQKEITPLGRWFDRHTAR
jgi:peptidoglycan/LPS O-acetylase OafA/YrhL